MVSVVVGVGVFGAVATRRVVVEVDVPSVLEEDFIRTLRERLWELYLIYKWLQMPEAGEDVIESLAREAKRKVAER